MWVADCRVSLRSGIAAPGEAPWREASVLEHPLHSSLLWISWPRASPESEDRALREQLVNLTIAKYYSAGSSLIPAAITVQANNS